MPGNAGVLVIPVQNAFTSPAGTSFFGGNLTTAIKNGTLTSTRLDDMATRILAAWYLTQQDGDATYAKGPRYTVDVRTTAHTQVARDVAAASIVLLKNTNSALPLSKSLLSKGLAVIGSDAVQPNLPLISAYVGSLDLNALITGWGSGAATTTTFAAVRLFLFSSRMLSTGLTHVRSPRTFSLHKARQMAQRSLSPQTIGTSPLLRLLPLAKAQPSFSSRPTLARVRSFHLLNGLLTMSTTATVITSRRGTTATFSSTPSRPSTRTPSSS